MATALVPQAVKAVRSMKRAEVKLLQVLPDLRAECEHLRLIEAEYVSNSYFPSQAPRRMCLDCGVEEKGWGAGYKVLTKEPVKVYVDRGDFFDQRPFPGYELEVGWCYGNCRATGHAVPRRELGQHHRCPEHSSG